MQTGREQNLLQTFRNRFNGFSCTHKILLLNWNPFYTLRRKLNAFFIYLFFLNFVNFQSNY